jgi:hypothetical protein
MRHKILGKGARGYCFAAEKQLRTSLVRQKRDCPTPTFRFADDTAKTISKNPQPRRHLRESESVRLAAALLFFRTSQSIVRPA